MNREFLSILDRRFTYTAASQTDIRKTFERVKKELQAKKRRGSSGESPNRITAKERTA